MADVTTPPRPASEAGEGGNGQVREAADQAREKAQEAKENARGRVREQVDQRSTDAGEQVVSTAGDLRTVGEELRKQGKETPAKLADQAAERTERLGGYLRDSDADRLLGDVEDFARQRPWAVVAGGLALGFAASRFLKASSANRYRSAETQQPESEPITEVSQPAPVPSTSAVPPYAPPQPGTAPPAVAPPTPAPAPAGQTVPPPR